MMMQATVEGVRVEVGTCRLDTDDDVALDAAYALLDEEEQARAAAFVFDEDRERYVRAHGYLRRRLAAATGTAPQDVPIVAEEGGKPYVPGHAVGFNLSHSGDYAVVAVTDGADVGVDIETAFRAERLELEGLSQICMGGHEQDAIGRLSPDRQLHRFLTFWTAKEARMKLTGEGMALDPLEIALDLSDGRAVGYLAPRDPVAALRFVPVVIPDAVCCLAVRREA